VQSESLHQLQEEGREESAEEVNSVLSDLQLRVWRWRHYKPDGTRLHSYAVERRSEGQTFYHGRCVMGDSRGDDTVLSYAAERSMAWWLSALHNAAHRRRLPFVPCRLLDWVSGGYCLIRLGRIYD
jgi:hypothetical protein